MIPEFFYRKSELFHRHHNLVNIELRTFLETGRIKVKSDKQKTGEFDLFKFCKDCDSKVIGSYEKYVCELFYAGKLLKGKVSVFTDKVEYIEFSNVDYTKLKLLFLSILWRASLSDRPLFSAISLDDKNMEEIRKMIYYGVPKNDSEFPVFFMTTVFDTDISNDYLFQPIQMKVANENGFMFAFGGMIVIFTMGIDGHTDSILKYRIQESGILRILKVPPGKMFELINDWYNK